MNSDSCLETTGDEGVSDFICQSSVKKGSVQAQAPSKFYNEKLATPRLRCAVFVDKAKALRCRRPSGRPRPGYSTTETEVLVSVLSSGNYHKPWPSRKGAGVEELVKYMSRVPCYLQQSEKVENVQEKALNFGVIDWRRLEKWTNSQKTEVSLKAKTEVSHSIKKPMTSPLKNQSCSYSARSSSNKLAQWKKTSSLDRHQAPSTEEQSKHEDRITMQTEAGNLTEAVKSNHCETQNSTHDGQFSSSPLERISLDPLPESSVGCKTLSAMADRKPMKVPKSFSVKLSPKSSHQCDESDTGAVGLLAMNRVTSLEVKKKNEEANHIGKSTSNLMVSTEKQSGNQKVEGINVGKKQQLMKHTSVSGLKWLSRNSSLKDMSTSQLKDVVGLDHSDDRERSNSRRNRSPLRRILDPLFKRKNDDTIRPTPISSIHHSQELLNISLSSEKEFFSNNAMDRSCDASIGPSNNSQVPLTSHGLPQSECFGVPMRKALVKLAWKNEQPLFMFSTNENDVLVASTRSEDRLGKDDPAAVYTIVTAQESKKNGGIWTKQSRNRRPNLLYDVVGHMEVSCSKLSSFDSKNLEISRQFVLVGDKHLPGEVSMNSVHSCELAAIIVKAPYQNLKGSIYDTQVGSLLLEKYPEYSRMYSVAAVLPSGIHGHSDTGRPSTIIERWKSGGSCDCGGWDEGCKLTVLADRLPDTKITCSVPDCPATPGFHGMELFFQGKKGENKYAFSMIAFKEGLYTLEFGPSMTSLQAFAICIAILHNISIDDNCSRMSSIQRIGGLSGYEPQHPPFSPVGRS